MESVSKVTGIRSTEYIIAEVLLASGAVMRYQDIQQSVAEYGVGAAVFKQRMSQSPIVRKYAPGIYGLSGVDAPTSAVNALMGPSRRSRVLQDCGWTDSGAVWIAYTLRTYPCRN